MNIVVVQSIDTFRKLLRVPYYRDRCGSPAVSNPFRMFLE